MSQSMIPAYLAVSLQGKNLLEASAGTGKTFTVALLYLRALLGVGTSNDTTLTVQEVLVVTFTNAATEELIGRVRARIKEALLYIEQPGEDTALEEVLQAAYQLREKEQCRKLLKTALSNISFAHISTIHSFCAEICKSVAIDSCLPLSITLSTDSELIDQSIKDVWRENIGLGDKFYQSSVKDYSSHEGIYRKALSKQMNKLQLPDGAILQEEFFALRPERKILEQFFEKNKTLYNAPYNNDEAVIQALDNLYGVGLEHTEIKRLVIKFFTATALTTNKLKAKADEDLKKRLCKEVTGDAFFAWCDKFHKSRKVNLPFVDYRYFYKSYHSLVERLTMQESNSGTIYSDRLIQLAAGVSKEPRVADLMRKRLPLAIIDEFQDTDPFQYRLFNNIYNTPDCGLLMVGDPKQAIYAFRGGDIHTYLKAKHDVANHYDLENNFRSADAIVDGINVIFSQPLLSEEHKYHQQGAFNQKDIDFLSISAKADKSLLLIECNGEENSLTAVHGEYIGDNADCSLNSSARQHLVAENCSDYISKLLALSLQGRCYFLEKDELGVKKTSLKHSHIALLVNSHGEAAMLKASLLEKGIASLTQSRESIYQEQEAYDCWLILRAMLEPTNHHYFEAALLAKVNGLGYRKVYEVINTESLLQDWIAQFHELNGILLEKGPLVAMTRWFNLVGATQSFMLLENDRQATNVTQLLELLQEDYTLFGGGLKLLTRFERAISTADSADESLLRLESDEERVQIITIHSSKGLEYPVVFVPFAWRDSVTMKDKLYSTHDDEGNVLLGFSEEMKNAQKSELKDEKLRLFYVALTRASRHLVLYFIDSQISKGKEPSKAYNKSPLGWYFPTEKDSESVQSAHASFEKALAKVNEGCLSLSTYKIEDNTDKEAISDESHHDKIGREFSETIDQRMGITSFSTITRGYSVALKDDDEEGDLKEEKNNTPTQGRDKLAKGAHIGTALHNVLEFTDFTRWADKVEERDKELLSELVRRELKANGVLTNIEKLESALPAYTQWIIEVMNTPFLNIHSSSSVALKDLTNWYPELTFTFSLERHFSKKGLGELLAQLDYNLSGLSGASIYGMLTGAIDLVFLHEGKYYLADYKSNHLGDNFSAYDVDTLAANNDKKAYTLQYLIYTVALHKHLKERIDNYDYDSHFGGVFYLYIRGMHPQQGNKGIFFDLPDKSVVEALSDYFSDSIDGVDKPNTDKNLTEVMQ